MTALIIIVDIISIIIDIRFIGMWFSGFQLSDGDLIFRVICVLVSSVVAWVVLEAVKKKEPERSGVFVSILWFQGLLAKVIIGIVVIKLLWAVFGKSIVSNAQNGGAGIGASQPQQPLFQQQPAPQPEEPYDRVIANPRQTRKCALCRNFNGGRGSSSIKFKNRSLCEFNGKEVGSCPYVGKTTAGTNAPCRGYFSSKYEDL